MAKRTYIIGDIHGCFFELVKLLADCFGHAEANEVEFVSIGDVIDKGPASADCVKQIDLMEASDFGSKAVDVKWTMVLGNHEEKFLRYVKHLDRRDADPSYRVPMEPKSEWTAELIAQARDSKSILRNGKLWHKIPGKEIIVVHGGIEPLMKELPSQDIKKAPKHAQNVLRTRYVNPDGRMIMIGKEDFKVDRWWADVYDGRFGFVVYGHQPFREPYRTEHAMGIDTGCVHGRTLTAWCVETDEFITVAAERLYATQWKGPGRG